jgi:hypothetical protein
MNTVGFTEQETTQELVLPTRPLSLIGQNQMVADLGGFPSRDIKIHTFTWTAPYTTTHIDPWALTLNNVALANKLSHFRNFRAILVLRITINGNPFQFGRMLVAYEPLNGTTSVMDYQYRMSQLPHIMCDPQATQSHVMKIPYVSPYNYVDLTSATGARVGILHFFEFNELRTVSDNPIDDPDISVFAHFEDVELCVPTLSSIATFTAQSKKKKGTSIKQARQNSFIKNDDEYDEDGPVSAVSSAVAKVAGALKDVPFIGSFALATEMGANTVTSLAKMFGFSKPNNIDAPSYYKVLNFSQFAPGIGSDMTYKLTVDPRQEVSIDPNICGIDSGDEMSIASISQIPSVLKFTNWTGSDAVGSVLVTINVTPGAVNSTAVTGGTKYFPSAMQFVSMPFEHWSGSLVYYIQIVCTKFHKGRLRFTYVPDGAAFSETSYNTALSAIVDISETTNYQLNVGWTQDRAYKLCTIIGTGDAYDGTLCNGRLYVSVVNKLTSPSATDDVHINVWGRAGEDFEVRNPGSNNNWQLYSTFAPQSSGDAHDLVDVPFIPDANVNGNDLAFFGESIESMRLLCKRFCFDYAQLPKSFSVTNNDIVNVNSYNIRHYPVGFGYHASGWNTTSAAAKFDYNANTYVSYMIPAYLGVRGAIRYKIVTPARLGGTGYNNTVITRDSATAKLTTDGGTNTAVSGSSSAVAKLMLSTTIGQDSYRGACVVMEATGNGIEVESPNYNPLRYNDAWGHSYANERQDILKVTNNHTKPNINYKCLCD